MALTTRAILLSAALHAVSIPAWAHAFMIGAFPPAGSHVPTAPAQLMLRFTEPVEPGFSTVELTGPAGPIAGLGSPRVPDSNANALVVALPALPPGTYRVLWHATSFDTHKTEGSFQFTIDP